jgi:hypothetical protein
VEFGRTNLAALGYFRKPPRGFSYGAPKARQLWLRVGTEWGVDSIRQWRMLLRVDFVETPTFTRLIGKVMDDVEYAKLQLALVPRPD